MEIGRLHNILKNVAVLGSTLHFTNCSQSSCEDVVMISDGVKAQAMVSSITSTTVFVVTNDAVGAFGFVGNVTVSADFSSRFEKGSNPFLL
jgi:hypothetical protein